MSYILEALKKSQQERELGRVPTLDPGGIFDEDQVAPARALWPLVAVVLATLSLFLALYAALRDPVSAPVSAAAGHQVVAASGGPLGGGGALSDGPNPAPQPVPSATAVGRDSAPPRQGPPGVAPDDPVRPLAQHQAPARAATPTPVPLVEPPPPKRSGRVRPQDPSEISVYGEGTDGKDPGPADGPDAEAELDLQRQMEADEDWIRAGEAYAESAPTPVPRDLIADIESFKREVRGAKGSETPQKLRTAIDEAPERLRLTPAQEADLPSYLMTVHVFDQDRGRRFVLINGMRYREGETTREGLRVERILAQGAVLSHKGNPFFVSR